MIKSPLTWFLFCVLVPIIAGFTSGMFGIWCFGPTATLFFLINLPTIILFNIIYQLLPTKKSN